MTVNGGDCVLSTITGIRPLGLSRRNQSFFCSLVMMLLGDWVRLVARSRFQTCAHLGGGPFRAINVCKLLQHDLYFHAIRSVHGDEMKTLTQRIS